ncbi:MAG: mechanosensitive ion channel [Thiolinea sp.]
MNIDAMLEWLQIYMTWVIDWMLQPYQVIQYLIIIGSFFIAAYTSRIARKHIRIQDDAPPGNVNKATAFIRRASRRLTFPFTLLLLLGLGMLAYRFFGYPYTFLTKAAYLGMAWGLIRFATAFISNPVLSRTMTTLIWMVAAVAILGYLQFLIDWLNEVKLSSDKNGLSLYGLIMSTLSVAAFVWGALFLSGLIDRALHNNPSISLSAQALFSKISRFSLLAIAFLIGLNAVGIDLTAFAVFGGAVGVGIGLGLQKVFSNLIAGIILLMDKSIKPGDTIVVDGRYGKVDRLSARYVSMITRDGIEYLIPNDQLINNQVENWSYTDENVRLRIPIGVHYQSDLKLAMALCLEAAAATPRVIKFPKPACLIKGFGDNSVDLEVRIWVRDPMNGCANVKSEVMLHIWERFHEHGVEIPYPQRDLHLRSVEAELEHLFTGTHVATAATPPDA